MDKPLFEKFKEWLGSGLIGGTLSRERLFFDMLEGLGNVKINRQFSVLNYKVDGVIEKTIDNCGDLNIDKETLSMITCFEFDDNYHSGQIQQDIDRQVAIMLDLVERYDIVKFFRIKEEDLFHFIRYAAPYYAGIETSLTSDKIGEYEICVDGSKKQTEQSIRMLVVGQHKKMYAQMFKAANDLT